MSQKAFPLRLCLIVVIVLSWLSQAVAAQSVPVPGPAPVHPGGAARVPHPRQTPCWEVAGISKGAMDQRRGIQQKTRLDVEAVCADASLNPQIRQQRIRQIHEQSTREMDALVTPQQMEELKSCQMSRNHGGGHGGGHPGAGGGRGPCGEMPPAKSGSKPPPGAKPQTAEPEED